jgi:hypothetical protein
MKPFLLLCFLVISFSLSAQPEVEYKEPSKESQAYHKFRTRLTYPSYSFEKTNTAIRKQVFEDSESNLMIKDAVYNSFSPREKFTYNMLHGEWFSQNCEAMPPIQDEQTKIFSYLPDVFDEFSWSDRQLEFFKSNRDSVLEWIKVSASKNNRVGINYKQVIVEINGTELIPFLIKTYSVTKKDHDILTLLMLLMKDNNYEPFINSASYKKLYGETANYQDYLSFNRANEDLIIKRATEFYNGKKN